VESGPPLPLPRRQEEEAEGGGHPEGEGHVDHVVASDHDEPEGGAEDRRRREPRAAAEEGASQVIGEEDSAQPHDRPRQPGGELGEPEDLEDKGFQPVVERRFLEVLDVVQVGGDEVSPFEHLAGDLRVAPLVGIDEGELAQPLEKGEAEDDGEHEEVAQRGRLPAG
jgi:hypothetical protein